MSDGSWDAEYEQADYVKERIEQYCKDNKLQYPIFKNHMQLNEVESIFDELKTGRK